jgi:hypothetical protein
MHLLPIALLVALAIVLATEELANWNEHRLRNYVG